MSILDKGFIIPKRYMCGTYKPDNPTWESRCEVSGNSKENVAEWPELGIHNSSRSGTEICSRCFYFSHTDLGRHDLTRTRLDDGFEEREYFGLHGPESRTRICGEESSILALKVFLLFWLPNLILDERLLHGKRKPYESRLSEVYQCGQIFTFVIYIHHV